MFIILILKENGERVNRKGRRTAVYYPNLNLALSFAFHPLLPGVLSLENKVEILNMCEIYRALASAGFASLEEKIRQGTQT